MHMHILHIFIHTYHIWVPNKTWKNVFFIYYGLSNSGTLGTREGTFFLKQTNLYIISIYKMFLVNDDDEVLYHATQPGKGILHVAK